MKFSFICALFFVSLLSACASQEKACEDVTLASEQIQECQALQRQIASVKDKPLIRTELERRYQTDCIEMRYYRDEHQQAICGNKASIEQLKKTGIEQKKP